MVDVDAILAGARLPEKIVKLCLRGDMQTSLEEAEQALAQAKSVAEVADSLAGVGAGVRGAEVRIEQIRQTMVDHVLPLTLRALPRPRFAALLGEHPPREDRPGDRALGCNESTMMPFLARACLVDPQLSEQQWTRLLDVITDRQWDEISWAAWMLNRGEVSVPLPSAASPTPRSIGLA